MKITDEIIREVIKGVSEGLTITSICKDKGYNRPYINTILKREYKEEYQSAINYSKREITELMGEAAKLIRKGYKGREAARETGLPLSYTFKVFKVEEERKIENGNTIDEVIKREVFRGSSKLSIAQDLNLSTRTIDRRLKSMNLHLETKFEKEIKQWTRRKIHENDKRKVDAFFKRCTDEGIQLDDGSLKTEQQMNNLCIREELNVDKMRDREYDHFEYNNTAVMVPFNERTDEDQIKLFNSDLWYFEHNLTPEKLNEIIDEVSTIKGMSAKSDYLAQHNISLTDLIKRGFN